ncbi:MAG: PLD nuclease N-terminal domain-containing protein [Acidiferrobacteraceae bacterium]
MGTRTAFDIIDPSGMGRAPGKDNNGMAEPYSLLGILIVVLDIIAIISVLFGNGTVGHKGLWIVLVLIFPVIGMILYYLFGRSPCDA